MFELRGKHLVLGALVADAASVGLHWIYNQDHIRKVVPSEPEFTPPNPAFFEGVPAYFAHGTRSVGQVSHYGAQALVMMQALAAERGSFVAATFCDHFRQYFGYGGGWVGYIDNATRETLNNMQRDEDAVIAGAQQIPFDGGPRLAKSLAMKALTLSDRYEKEDRTTAMVEATQAEGPEVADFGQRILDFVSEMPRRRGAVDQQMSATAKLPPLIARLAAQGTAADSTAFRQQVDAAVLATNDHQRARDFGHGCAAMMATALETDDLDAVVASCEAALTPDSRIVLQEAQTLLNQPNVAVTAKFGMACDLVQGVPSIVHNLLTAPTFEEAIRQNIYSGGDSCGRAMILGAILGAVHGVGGEKGIPKAWIDKLSIEPDVRAMLDLDAKA